MNIWEINRELAKLSVEGVNLPSSKTAVKAVFGDVLTADGMIKDFRSSHLSKDEYEKTIDRMFKAIPDFFNTEKIKQGEIERLYRVINNYNKTVSPSKWINTNGMTFNQLVEAAHLVGVRTATLNIYDPRFGLTLSDIMQSYKDQMRGEGE